jgi:hypothetical protein
MPRGTSGQLPLQLKSFDWHPLPPQSRGARDVARPAAASTVSSMFDTVRRQELECVGCASSEDERPACPSHGGIRACSGGLRARATLRLQGENIVKQQAFRLGPRDSRHALRTQHHGAPLTGIAIGVSSGAQCHLKRTRHTSTDTMQCTHNRSVKQNCRQAVNTQGTPTLTLHAPWSKHRL